jgi:DNA-binding NarL/FixJ family response regulator
MHDDPTVALETQAAGVADYVLKDTSFDELAVAVPDIAAGGTLRSAGSYPSSRPISTRSRTTKAARPAA